MVHQGLRVCEECRRVRGKMGLGEGGVAAGPPHKRQPQGEEGRGGKGVGGPGERGGRAVRHGDAAAASSVGNTAKLNPSAHIAYPSWSPVEENMLSRCLTNEKINKL